MYFVWPCLHAFLFEGKSKDALSHDFARGSCGGFSESVLHRCLAGVSFLTRSLVVILSVKPSARNGVWTRLRVISPAYMEDQFQSWCVFIELGYQYTALHPYPG